ncbi:alginate export family protein [Nitrococcus mobilis]|uniref:alginate export family protein n=1 Tax=Nitrococcus mobilis TaxID=35797 RepID=UPI001E5CB5F7|nr:alginate export family protein [Nitrococcus mobilis]
MPALGGILILTLLSGGSAYADAKPWRLHEALSAPAWLDVGGTYRARFEHLDGDFRAGSSGSTQILVGRLLFGVQANFDPFYIGAELEDSRSQLDDSDTPLGTDDVDAIALLRAYIGAKGLNMFAAGDQLDVTAGRLTIDLGSRRLVARNRFRNTINGFTGVNALWQGPAGTQLQTFYTLPVHRRPTDRDRLDDNDIVTDTESFKVRFWAVDLRQENLFGGATGEAYVFGLHEDDGSDVPTANRRLLTPGVRLFSAPAKGAWDFEVEAAGQVGKSRSTTSSADTTDLDHRAGFVHAHLAHTFDAPWSPRLVLQYDFASGDGDPNDGENNRFDTLFGARRWEFGPTGIYGALARSNINSPGTRIEIKPSPNLNGFVGYRAVWLASDRDALTTAEVRDPGGASGSFVGHQIEARVRADVLPGNLGMEFGGAYLFDGEFLKKAPNAAGNGDTAYFYTQSTLTF